MIKDLFRFSRWMDEIDNTSLIVFRVLFGFLLVAEAWGAILTGWVERAFIEPKFTFTFIGFEWLQPLPGYGMYFYYGIMGVFGVLVIIGWRYRWSMAIYGLFWTGCYLMQKSSYNNHYYFLVLMCVLMVLVPAHRYFSLDVKRNPALKSATCPRWAVGILILQVGIVYVYASVAKMNPDWIAGKSVDVWFDRKVASDYMYIGEIYSWEWLRNMIVYGGLFFDLLITFFLLWKPTRWPAMIISIFFHLFNSFTFQIGIFPYMMIGLSLLFFPGETFRKWWFKNKPAQVVQRFSGSYSNAQKLGIAFLSLWFLVQIALPLRHWYFPGDVHWTEEGHRLSWHMMTRSKSGFLHPRSFKVVDPEKNQTWFVNPADHLSKKQLRAMGTRPDMVWQFAQYLEEFYREKGHDDVEVYAFDVRASLNGRPLHRLIDPNVDLSEEEWHPLSHHEWILQLPEEENK